MVSNLREALLRMLRMDSEYRDQLAREGRLMDAYDPLMEKIHTENGRRLEKIIAEHGWPHRQLVGEDGEEAAWVLAQHAISMPTLQKKVLSLLKLAESPTPKMLRRIAKLEDRICFFEGRKQKYGTNFDWDENQKMSPTPIDEPEKVDVLRSEMGLPPLAKAIEKMRRDMQEAGLLPPKDPQSKQREFADWLRRSGWSNT